MMDMREYIESRCEKVTESGCWIWMGATLRKQGHGDCNVDGQHTTAHRRAYEAFVGEIANGLHVLHRCDVPPCCNPAHLFLGTNQDNINDSMKKGRRKGITRRRPSGLMYSTKPEHGIWNCKLSKEDRLSIKERYDKGNISQYQLAIEFNVSQTTIQGIVSGKRKML